MAAPLLPRQEPNLKLLDLANLNPPPLNWLYKPWLERNALTVIVGAGGTGKSYATLDAAIALAAGQSWLEIAGPGTPVNTLLVDEDGPQAELMRRIAHLCAGRDIEPSSLTGSLFIAPSSGLQLNEAADYAVLRELITAKKIEYVVFDALIALHSLDENKTSDMKLLMRGILRRLMRETGIGVAVLHHEARPVNPKTGAPRKGAMKGRGSVEIINAGDNQLHVQAQDGISILATSRNRLLPVIDWPEPIAYSVQSLGDSTRIIPTASDSTVSACVAHLRALMRNGVEIGSVRATHKLLTERGFNGSRNTVWRAIHSLRETALA